MNLLGCKLLKKYGDTEKNRQLFLQESERCQPKLERGELDVIYHNDQNFYCKEILRQEGYIAPEIYLSMSNLTLEPKDLTDIGQATVVANIYKKKFKYSKDTGFLYYDGIIWIEDGLKVHGEIQRFSTRQLAYAEEGIKRAKEEMSKQRLLKFLDIAGKKECERHANPLNRNKY